MLTINVRPPLKQERRISGRPIRFYAPTLDPAHGYGRLALACMDALKSVYVGPHENPDFVLGSPGCYANAKVLFTMWEPSELPEPMKGCLSSPALIVPCSHNVDVFRGAGFKRSIHIVPLYGEARYSPMPSDEVLKFICVARDNGVRSRKGIDDLIVYFKEAFPSQKDVKLTIKCSPNCDRRSTYDERVEMIHAELPKDEYENLLAGHHCGIFLSGLEGWNFPACELMAAGRPSIIVPFGGPVDFTTEDTSYYLDYEMVKAPEGHPYQGVGQGAKPKRDSVISTLRSVYADRETLKMKAVNSHAQSSKFTKAQFTERLRIVAQDILGSL